MFARLPTQGVVLEKFELYSTKSHYYLVGHDKAATAFKLLKLSRLEAELEAIEDPHIYTKVECTALLRSIRDGNLRIGGLQSVCKGRETAAEKRYRKLLLSGLELNKDFYFSYTYNLARTLQANLTTDAPADPFDSMFVWNEFLSRPLRQAVNSSKWVIPLIHGFWQQRSLALFGRTLTVSLIARRSKHFAGTRYRKRGVNFKGQVANDVETEQLIDAGIHRRTAMPELASCVQVRGSIPLYWNQEGITTLKPDITLQHYDPLYTATRLHFEDISARYGHPVVVLNLVKSAEKRPRETILRKEFAISIAYINQQKPEKECISYIPWDFNYHAKQRGTFILSDMAAVIKTCLDATSFFSISQAQGEPLQERGQVQVQHGVLRTNCIDCLDRTNVAQFAYGLAAMGQQLHGLGLADSPTVDAQSSAARELMDMYEAMGNVLSRQYGGSEAHSTFFQRQRGDWEAATQSRDFITSIRRFYSNTYTDAEKQDAINLFLGNFVPRHDQPALWQLDTDYFLHTGHQFNKPIAAAAMPPSTQASSGGSNQQESSQISAQQAVLPQQTYIPSTKPVANSHETPSSPSVPTVVLPCMQKVDLQNAQQAERKPHNRSSSSQASASLRDTVKQTLAEAAEANDNASSPSTAALATQPPEGTSPDRIQLLSDAAAGESSTGTSSACLSANPHGNGNSLTASRSPSAALSQLPTEEEGIDTIEASTAAAHGAEAGSSPPLPANLSILQFARQSAVERLHRRPKLESFDKIIGNPANTPHHISLQAAPETQKPYLPHWLASPLGMHATQRSTITPNQASAGLFGTASASRLTTEDTEVGHSQHGPRNGAALDALQQNWRQQLQQPDPHDMPLTPLQPAPSPHADQDASSLANPFASLSQAAFSPPSKPSLQRSMKRALSEASMQKLTSNASLSPGHRLQSSSSLELAQPEDSFVSLQLQTVRPTAPRPYSKQASHPSLAQTPHLRPPSRGKGSLGMLRARSLDGGSLTSPTSIRSGFGSGLSRRPSFGDLASFRQTNLARHGAYKHSPRRRITFPTHTSSSAAQRVRHSSLEPVQEGKQLPSSSALPGMGSIEALRERLLGEDRQGSRNRLPAGLAEQQAGSSGQLGMRPEVAAWWSQSGLPQDPLQDCLGREQQARAAYRSLLHASQSPLDPLEQWALEEKYANLCNFVIHISMDGFSEGPASKWRQQEGLVGSITCAEALLQDLAAQCKTSTV